MDSKLSSKNGDVLVVEPVVPDTLSHISKSKHNKQSAAAAAAGNPDEYLNEYDEYYFDHEKYLQAGHGGKQRNKKEIEINSARFDPSGNVRKITSNLQNFEHNRRK